MKTFSTSTFHDSNLLAFALLRCYQQLSLSAGRLTLLLDMERRTFKVIIQYLFSFYVAYPDCLYLFICIGRVWTHQLFPFKPLKAPFKLYQKREKSVGEFCSMSDAYFLKTADLKNGLGVLKDQYQLSSHCLRTACRQKTSTV